MTTEMEIVFKKFVEKNCPTFFERLKEQNLNVSQKCPLWYILDVDCMASPEGYWHWNNADKKWRDELRSRMEYVYSNVSFGMGYIKVGCEMRTPSEWLNLGGEDLRIQKDYLGKETLEFIKKFAKEKFKKGLEQF